MTVLNPFQVRQLFGRLTTIIIAAQRNSGKSVLTRDILHHLSNDYDILIGCSETYDGLQYLRQCTPLTIGEELRAEFFTELMQLGFVHKERGLEQLRILLDLDDYGSNRDIARSRELQRVWSNGRHAGITGLLVLQSVTQSPPGIRSNSEVAMFSRSSNDAHRKLVQKEFMAYCEPQLFKSVYAKGTSRFSFLIVDTAAAELTVDEAVRYYRADPDITASQFGARRVHVLGSVLEALAAMLLHEAAATNRRLAAADDANPKTLRPILL